MAERAGKAGTGPLVDGDPIPGGSTGPATDADGFISQKTIERKATGPFLVGRSDIATDRVVTRADFASKGIEQDTLTFNWLQGYKLPVEGINPEAVKYLVENEYGFSISED